VIVDREEMGRRSVLLTGAAGRIGTGFWRATGDRYRFRLADRDADSLGEARGHEVVNLDVADPEGCRSACDGIDTVVHLAADPSPEADFPGSLLANNIVGTYNVFQAAADAGCRRVVFASSGHAVAGYPSDVQPGPASPVRPANMYGVSKCFGEATASCFAETGLSAIAVRIGWYEPPAEVLRGADADLAASGFVSARDLNQLLTRCIETPDIDFAIVYGISDNRFKRFDLTSTKRLLGYAPEDDGFRLLER
jgi:nucleoside-diphosphate-sugar epimerase